MERFVLLLLVAALLLMALLYARNWIARRMTKFDEQALPVHSGSRSFQGVAPDTLCTSAM